MTEQTTATEIIECVTATKIPKVMMFAYLTNDPQHAIDRYKARYGRAPVRIYHFGHCYYAEVA